MSSRPTPSTPTRSRRYCEPVRRRIARWVLDNADALSGTKPERPEGLNDRAWNNWKPLLTIAAVAGGEWPERARKAAMALSGADVDEDLTTSPCAMSRPLSGTPTSPRPRVERDDAPWAKWWADDVALGRIKAPGTRLAKLFKDLDIKPEQIRFGDVTARYWRESFESAWETYAPGTWQTYAADIPKDERAPSPQNDGTHQTNGTPEGWSGADVPSVPSVPSSEGRAISPLLDTEHPAGIPPNTLICSRCRKEPTFGDDGLCGPCPQSGGGLVTATDIIAARKLVLECQCNPKTNGLHLGTV